VSITPGDSAVVDQGSPVTNPIPEDRVA